MLSCAAQAQEDDADPGMAESLGVMLRNVPGRPERWLQARAVATRAADKNGISRATHMAGSLTVILTTVAPD